MKICFKCKLEKPFDEYYKHKQMGDGYLNKCKSCTKRDARANRKDKIDFYRDYDRKRGNRQGPDYIKEYRNRYPEKYKAQTMVNNAIRDKKLFREPCEVCGKIANVHAHHDDYAKPLNIRWLCPVHHKEWHEINGEGKNG